MLKTLSSLVPNIEDFLALEAEEAAAVLLVHLNSYFEGGGSTGGGSVQLGKINQYNFFNDLNQYPQYPKRQTEANRVLMEAWSWLQAEGFLVRDADNNAANSVFLSRRATRLKSLDDFAAYRKASLLPKGQLHALIASKVYPAFLRGEYDTAVFQAFREVENRSSACWKLSR